MLDHADPASRRMRLPARRMRARVATSMTDFWGDGLLAGLAKAMQHLDGGRPVDLAAAMGGGPLATASSVYSRLARSDARRWIEEARVILKGQASHDFDPTEALEALTKADEAIALAQNEVR
jgi:hypothetical protein